MQHQLYNGKQRQVCSLPVWSWLSRGIVSNQIINITNKYKIAPVTGAEKEKLFFVTHIPSSKNILLSLPSKPLCGCDRHKFQLPWFSLIITDRQQHGSNFSYHSILTMNNYIKYQLVLQFTNPCLNNKYIS